MIFIIAGIIIGIILMGVIIFNDGSEKMAEGAIGLCIVIGIICSVLFNCGYKEKALVNELELVALDNSVIPAGGGNLFYAHVSPSMVYSYRYEKENNTGLPGKLYETKTVAGNVEELESAECKKPVLLEYKQEAKGKFWINLLAMDKTSYLFYVPEGTILKEVVLN